MITNILTKKELNELIEYIDLATFNKPLISQDVITKYEIEKDKDYSEMFIYYSENHRVRRMWKKPKKHFPPYHRINKNWVKGVGKETWMPYNYQHMHLAENKFILWHEGEKACDYAMTKGILSTTLMGAKVKDEKFITQAITLFQGIGIKGAIYLIDHDDTGIRKSKYIQNVAKKLDFPVFCLPIEAILPKANKGDDFVEYLKSNPKQSTNQIKNEIEDIVSNFSDSLIKDFLEAAESDAPLLKISNSNLISQVKNILTEYTNEVETNLKLEELRKRSTFSEYGWENKVLKPIKRELKEDRLKLEIQLYMAETDAFKRIQHKQRICSTYSLNNADFQGLIGYSESSTSNRAKVLSFEELMNSASAQEDWLIPSFVPVGEMLLLTALSKVGKTLLANDFAYAVLSGGKVLTEKAKQGKVLYICSDESSRSLIRRFYSRGFDLLPETKSNLRTLLQFDLSNLKLLEEELEEHRPDLVIIDSLTSITLNLNISEKDAEFARNIYILRDLLKKYNSASILIHHDNKNNEAKGLNKISGSARIPCAVWGIAQLSGNDDFIDSDSGLIEGSNVRWLDVQPREGEKFKYELELNPKDNWSEHGIFKFNGEYGDPNGEKRLQGDQVLALLEETQLKLEYSEINEKLNFGRSLYTVLDRLCDRQVISRSRSENNPRRWVYFVDINSQEEEKNKNSNGQVVENISQKENALQNLKNTSPPLPPTFPRGNSSTNVQSIDMTKLDFSQQVSQQVSQQILLLTKKNELLNSENSCCDDVSGVSQQLSKKRGGGVVGFSIRKNKPNSLYCSENELIENEDIVNTLETFNSSVQLLSEEKFKHLLNSLDKPINELTQYDLMNLLETVWKLLEE